jgi:dipeptidyl aminopeptidase/acylaminoacyl peptidase
MLPLHRMGFNILFVNFRGSLGLGEENVRSLLGHVGDMDVKDCHHARQRCLDLYPHLGSDKVTKREYSLVVLRIVRHVTGMVRIT